MQCLHQIEEKLGWGDASGWSQRQFEDLAELLEHQSGIVISARTLSRLYKRDRFNPEYLPQKSTRQALVRFLGYDTWALYLKTLKKENLEPEGSGEVTNFPMDVEELIKPEDSKAFAEDSISADTFPKSQQRKAGLSIRLLLGVLLILGGIGWWVTKKYASEAGNSNLAKVVFSASPNKGQVPQSVRFNVEVPAEVADSFLLYIKSRDLPLRYAAGKVQLSRLFTLPLLSRAKVTTIEGKILASVNLHYTADEWVRSVLSNDQFFELGTTTKQDTLCLTEDELNSIGKDLNKVRFSSKFLLVRDFEVSLDTMTLQWEFLPALRPSYKKCTEMAVQLTSDSGLVLISFAPKGCEATLEIETPTQKLKGDVDNLSKFTYAGGMLHKASLRIASQKALVTLDDTLRATLALGPKPMGLLRALSFRVGFQGQVINPTLIGPSGKKYLLATRE